MNNSRILSIDEIRKLVQTILAPAKGDGELAASALIQAEILGHKKFGLRSLSELKEGSSFGSIEVIAEREAMCLLDASMCFGPVAMAKASREAVELASRAGIGLIGLKGVKFIGCIGPYVKAIAKQGLFGLAMTHGPPMVAPEGSISPIIGTNPIAYAAPSLSEPVVADFATSQITMAAVAHARETGMPLPEGSAIDSKGELTRDPERVNALKPFNGIKGYLVGLWVELFVGAMLGERSQSEGRGALVMAIDQELMGSTDATEQVEALSEEIRSSNALMPGDNAKDRVKKAHDIGHIELDEEVVNLLNDLVEDLRV